MKQPLYFVNRYVDFCFIGGASFLTFAHLRIFHSSSRTADIYMTAAWLSWVCNWPHFSATSFRLFQSESNRSQYPLTAWLVPFVVLAGIVGSLMSPTYWAPFLVKIYTIWSPYHFSGQTLGITLLYSRRAGFKVEKWERTALAVFIYSTFFSESIAAEVGTSSISYYGISYPRLNVPEWLVQISHWGVYAAMIAAVLVILNWKRKSGRFAPLILLTPAAAQYVWFCLGPSWLPFQEFVPFFHALQYILIAWAMQIGEKAEIKAIRPSKSYVWSESARWGVVNFVGGALLFYFIPKGISVATGLSADFTMGVFIAGVQVHHFFVDGVIWKLKNNTVSSPLMMNLSQLLHGREPVTEKLAA